MKLLVLSGGFGTRLANKINGLPKSLAPINGKPFLFYLLKSYLSQGITEFVFLLHYKSELIIEFLEKEKKSGILMSCSVEYVVEPEPKGTGGAIANAINDLSISENFLVTNGDTLLSSGVDKILNMESPAIAVKKEKKNTRYGSVEKKDNKIVSFNKEKDSNDEFVYINTGLYHLDCLVFANEPNQNFSIEETLFPKLVRKKILNSVTIDGSFIDIGIPEDYEKFCKLAKK